MEYVRAVLDLRLHRSNGPRLRPGRAGAWFLLWSTLVFVPLSSFARMAQQIEDVRVADHCDDVSARCLALTLRIIGDTEGWVGLSVRLPTKVVKDLPAVPLQGRKVVVFRFTGAPRCSELRGYEYTAAIWRNAVGGTLSGLLARRDWAPLQCDVSGEGGASSADVDTIQKRADVLSSFATLLEADRWATESRGEFNTMMRRVPSSIGEAIEWLIRQAVSAASPTAGRLQEAASAIEDIGHGIAGWNASSMVQVLTSMDAMARAQQSRPLFVELRELAQYPRGAFGRQLAATAAAAQLYSAMLERPERFVGTNMFWPDTVAFHPAARRGLQRIIGSLVAFVRSIPS